MEIDDNEEFPLDRTFLAMKSITGIQKLIEKSTGTEASFVVLGLIGIEESQEDMKYYLLEPQNARYTAYRLLKLANDLEGVKYQ